MVSSVETEGNDPARTEDRLSAAHGADRHTNNAAATHIGISRAMLYRESRSASLAAATIASARLRNGESIIRPSTMKAP